MTTFVDLNEEQYRNNDHKDDSREYVLHIVGESVDHTIKILGTAAANSLFDAVLELLDEGPDLGIHWLRISTSAIRIRDIIYISLGEAE